MKQEFMISRTRLYSILSGMKSRCTNPNDQHYKWYGAKGIKVCDAWSGKNGVNSFIEWALSNGYEENLTIDRIDSSGNYEPENCRWVTLSQNAMKIPSQNEQNSMIAKKIRLACTAAGISESELARRIGTSPQNLHQRLKTGKFSGEELEKIAEILGAVCVFEFRFPDGTNV